MSQRSFYSYFKENMETMGLPAPDSLFGKLATATATISAIVAAVEKFGRAVTLTELIGAGILSEKLLAVGACSAAFYAGACLGSLAVATVRTLSGGLSIADMFSCATAHSIPTPSWLWDTIATNPVLRGKGGHGIGRYPSRAVV
jgi:hypothetical protein